MFLLQIVSRRWYAFCFILLCQKQRENMHQKDLLKKIAKLESLNDQLQAELRYLDKLLRQVGFEKGLTSLKFAAKELLEQSND